MNPTVKVLAECFSLKKKAIRTQVKKNPNSRYIVLKKGVSYAKAQEFEKITADTKHNPNVQGVCWRKIIQGNIRIKHWQVM